MMVDAALFLWSKCKPHFQRILSSSLESCKQLLNEVFVHRVSCLKLLPVPSHWSHFSCVSRHYLSTKILVTADLQVAVFSWEKLFAGLFLQYLITNKLKVIYAVCNVWLAYNVEAKCMHSLGQQGWCSGDSARLPPMWPRLDFQTQHHLWVEFAGSLRGYSPGTRVFPYPQKPTFDLIWFSLPNY